MNLLYLIVIPVLPGWIVTLAVQEIPVVCHNVYSDLPVITWFIAVKTARLWQLPTVPFNAGHSFKRWAADPTPAAIHPRFLLLELQTQDSAHDEHRIRTDLMVSTDDHKMRRTASEVVHRIVIIHKHVRDHSLHCNRGRYHAQYRFSVWLTYNLSS